jgi:hypothetical protein
MTIKVEVVDHLGNVAGGFNLNPKTIYIMVAGAYNNPGMEELETGTPFTKITTNIIREYRWTFWPFKKMPVYNCHMVKGTVDDIEKLIQENK